MPNNNVNNELEELLTKADPIETKPRRIDSLDVTRGVAMMFIILLHFCLAWLDKNVVFIAAAGQIFLEFLGPGMFIVLSTISVVFTTKSKQGKVPESVIRNSIYMRGLFIIIIGFLYNLFSLNIWGWNILMFIGFAQIFTYYALKLRKFPRIIIGLIILFSSEDIRDFFWTLQNINPFFWIVNFIISSPQPEVTLLPWLSVCFIAPVFGEYIYDTMIEGTDEKYKHLVKVFLMWGIILALMGIFIGLEQKYFTDDLYQFGSAYPYMDLLYKWNQQNIAPVTGLVKFLITGTYSNVLYTLGLDLITIAIIFYIIDIMQKDNIFVRMLKFYGKASLTLFLIEYIFIPLFLWRFSVLDFLTTVFPFIGFLGILTFIWYRYGKGGIGSLEWLVGYVLGSKKKSNKNN
ncbi:MAG: heparan-alpha-glucosaminide N-acetyltransferase domain-containing protein [Promethearchaeota archaeon]